MPNMFTPKELHDWLVIASNAAQEAGYYLTSQKESDITVTKECGRDIKLEVDRGAEKIILNYLQKHSGFPILSEEAGLIGEEDSACNCRWIVDPLDGSLNFFKGLPLCCVSIGLWDGEVPLLGAIYDFIHRDLYTGIIGIGAWMNSKPIKVSSTNQQRKAILCTGFPVATNFSDEAITKFVQQVQLFKKIRLLGSAALSLASVASGKTDAYFERDIKIWDVAAGLAIVAAAGGQILKKPSIHSSALTVFVSNGLFAGPDYLISPTNGC